MLLTQVMQRHHMGVSQILQSVGNPGLPPELKDFLIGWIDSSSLLMARILRNFGHDDISRMLPERKIIENKELQVDNKGEQDQQAVELEELVKKQREAQPWFRLIVHRRESYWCICPSRKPRSYSSSSLS